MGWRVGYGATIALLVASAVATAAAWVWWRTGAQRLALTTPWNAALIALAAVGTLGLRRRAGVTTHGLVWAAVVINFLAGDLALLGNIIEPSRLGSLGAASAWAKAAIPPVAQLNCPLVAIALVCLMRPGRAYKWFGQLLACFVLAHAVVAIAAHLGDLIAFQSAGNAPPRLHSLASLGLLAIGVLAAQPRAGIVGAVRRGTVEGRAIRSALPVAVTVPLTPLAFEALRSTRAWPLGPRATLATFAATVATGAVLVIWRAGRIVRRLEAERARERQDLVRAREAAEANALARNTYFASLTHEIRSPMTAVLGYLELLRDTPHLTAAERARWIATMLESGEKVLATVNDVLDAAKMGAGEIAIRPQVMRPKALIDDVIQLFDRKARDRSLHLQAHYTAGCPEWVETDPHRLWQILVNLVSNAMKYTREGSVTLLLDAARTTDATARLTISVTDTGLGITPENQTRIFEPFARADEDKRPRTPGTGLGLYVARRIARALGGDLTLASAPGQGSSFTVHLEVPCAPATEADQCPMLRAA